VEESLSDGKSHVGSDSIITSFYPSFEDYHSHQEALIIGKCLEAMGLLKLAARVFTLAIQKLHKRSGAASGRKGYVVVVSVLVFLL